jgi:hypothetical protein
LIPVSASGNLQDSLALARVGSNVRFLARGDLKGYGFKVHDPSTPFVENGERWELSVGTGLKRKVISKPFCRQLNRHKFYTQNFRVINLRSFGYRVLTMREFKPELQHGNALIPSDLCTR